MSDKFKRKAPGDPLPRSATVYNQLLDMLAWWKGQQSLTGPDRKQVCQQSGIWPVKNTSGGALDRFSVVGIDPGNIFPTPTNNLVAFKNGPILRGVTPDEDLHIGRFAILLAPAAANAIVPACVAGVTVAPLYVNDADHRFAEMADAATSALYTAETGSAAILWKESGTGLKWGIVHIGATGTHQADVVKCQVNEGSGVAPTDASFSVDNVSVMFPHDAPAPDPAVTTLQNVIGLYLNDDDWVYGLWNDTAEQWEVIGIPPIEPEVVGCYVNNASGVLSSDATFAVDGGGGGYQVFFPRGAPAPNPAITTVANSIGFSGPDNAPVIVGRNHASSVWEVLHVGPASVELWAKVQAGFSNDDGSATRTVSVKACLWDGSGEAGAAFDTKTEIRANKDTALFTGYVVRYRVQADATKLIINDIWDSPIGTIVAVNAAGAIRDGWREIPAIDDHFLKHSDTDLGGTGGTITHLHNAHADHTIANHDQLGIHDPHDDHTIAPHGTDIDCFVDADISAYVNDPTHVGGAAPGLSHAAHSAHDVISVHTAGAGAGFGHAAHSNADHTPEHYKVQFVERFE